MISAEVDAEVSDRHDPDVTLSVDWSRWGWALVTMVTLLVSCSLLGAAVAAWRIGDHGWLVAAATTLSAVPFGFLTLPLWRLARCQPFLDVTDDGILVNHSGMLTRPFTLARDQIHSVYFGDDVSKAPRPAFMGSRWHRFRQWAHWLETGAAARRYRVNETSAPSLSDRKPNLLIVIVPEAHIGSLSRRGVGVIATFSDGQWRGISRWTIARGLFAHVDQDEARRVFAGWPTSPQPPSDIAAWINDPVPLRT